MYILNDEQDCMLLE